MNVTKELVGRIEYFVCSNHLLKAGTKRSRPGSTLPFIQPAESTFNPEFDTPFSQLPPIGIYFIPDTSSDNHGSTKLTQKYYQLVAPQGPVTQAVIDSARYHPKVTLTSYNIIHTNKLSQAGIKIQFIELHQHGIKIHHRQDMETIIEKKEAHSLQEIQDLECNRLKTQNDKRNTRYSLYGTVDSTSPIIGMPNDPFALVEIFQTFNDHEDHCHLTVVLVLKGPKVLLCHSGIRPGHTLRLINVRRQRWHVPQSFQQDQSIPRRLHQRAPSYVFVVSDPKNIQWCDEKTDTQGMNNIGMHNMHGSCAPPLPSTLFPLTSIQGRIVYIQYSTKRRNLQYVFLEYMSKRIKLHLSHFPLSPSLCLGLREGAWIQAINVHKIDSPVLSLMRQLKGVGYKCFGACLRSSIHLIETSSESHTPTDKGSALDLVDTISMMEPHAFKNIRQGYYEMEWISLSRRMLSNCPVSSKIMDRTLRNTAFNTCTKMNGIYQGNERDPYREWFDHGCEANEDVNGCEQEGSCPCETSKPQIVSLPAILSLTDIKDRCLKKATNILMKFCDKKVKETSAKFLTDRADIGWTASIEIETKDLHCSQNSIGTLATGGIIGNSENTKDGFMFLDDGISQCTFVPCRERPISAPEYFRHVKGDFVLTKIHCAIVSCIYLGECRPKKDQNCQTAHTLPLPSSLVTNNRPSLEGPSFLVQIRGNAFAISLQIQYDNEYFLGLENNIIPRQPIWMTGLSLSMAMSLSLSSSINDNETPVICKLLRQRWKIKKCSETYSGCYLTLAHVQYDHHADKSVCHAAQTSDIKLRIPLENKLLTDHSLCTKSISFSFSRNVMFLLAAWQNVAESILAPIVMGGWDEYTGDLQTNESNISEVYVAFPSRAVSPSGSKEVEISNLSSIIVRNPLSHKRLRHFVPYRDETENDIRKLFTHFGGRKMFFPGMLDLRMQRSIIFNSNRCTKFGEANVPPELITGVKSISLATLWRDLMLGPIPAQKCKRKVVKIDDAQLTSLRFCRARVECSRCFRVFIRRDFQNDVCSSTYNTERCFQGKPSFWDNPLPLKHFESHLSGGIHSDLSESTPRVNKRKLMCPSGCDDRHGAVKWELSCILNDDTGTAKLYADRDAVALLLGAGLDFDVISDGAWDTPVGISFQSGLPLDSNLRCELDTIKKEITRNKGSKKISPESLLSRESRARYELYKHCQRSKELHRKMDFLCQIKTHSTRKSKITSHELSLMSTIGAKGVVNFNDTSMSVEHLELTLIDCYKSYKTTANNAWDLVNSLKLT